MKRKTKPLKPKTAKKKAASVKVPISILKALR